jgi:cob(I)alamin adenosyltransferase
LIISHNRRILNRTMTDDQYNQLSRQIDTLATHVVNGFAEIKAELATKASADDLHKVITALADIGGQYKDHEQDHGLTDNQITRIEEKLDELAQSVGYNFQTHSFKTR